MIDADSLHMILVKMKDFGELTGKKAIRVVEKAPTIDAVPIEWLKCKRNEHKLDGFAWIFEAVIDEWRREHE